MTKWADFAVSAIQYGPNHKITNLKQHIDDGNNLGTGEIVPRSTVISNIKHGKSYITIFKGNTNWKKGKPIYTFMVDGEFFLRDDKNQVNIDNLSNISEF